MNEATSSGRFTFKLPNSEAAIALSGGGTQLILKRLENLTGAALVLRGLDLELVGIPSKLERAVALIELMRPLWEEGQLVSFVELQVAINALDTGRSKDHAELSNQVLARSQRGKLLRPRTLRQKSYVESMERNDLTFALGPAGTGKTFLATVFAVKMLSERKVERLILTRPAIEAGERLGFLPGDLQQKVDPYLRPLYDALHALLGPEKTASFLEKGLIEIAPLAYMRGRTLSDAFIILDEAQNATREQMKMFLTRLGFRSKMVVTGDITQIDLLHKSDSGLIQINTLLKQLEGIQFVYFSEKDVVRHELVKKIIKAYDQSDPKLETAD